MVLHRDLNTSIVTASVATVLFALVVAVFADNTTGTDVLATVAAYAAVLVVSVAEGLLQGVFLTLTGVANRATKMLEAG
ncbi:Uu.00g074800.m01.CDS01 [Anthostomella pinea]|uniref:Uu.00g074800.m01.CDS01 n=1 Tax=Anthostomella pinea TaxID=933095 RepID=A0AAI8YP46_9PEZI|nr:Uu.00g074800.m01.CDS01 [Anthostomella pinea]